MGSSQYLNGTFKEGKLLNDCPDIRFVTSRVHLLHSKHNIWLRLNFPVKIDIYDVKCTLRVSVIHLYVFSFHLYASTLCFYVNLKNENIFMIHIISTFMNKITRCIIINSFCQRLMFLWCN